MARNRTISPDFWTCEAVIDCQPMTRLLFIGLWNFADDFGVQPLRPRTIRMQVFPGDTMADDDMRAMIDALAAQGLVRIYEVDGIEYVAIVDWEQMQRVGKRTRRRYPAQTAQTMEIHGEGAAPADIAPTIGSHGNGPQTAETSTDHSNGAPPPGPASAWWDAIDARIRAVWPGGHSIDALEPVAALGWIDKWIADGCDLEHDVLAAVSAAPFDRVRRPGPLAGLHELTIAVSANRSNRLTARAAA